jgi:hypothetical protein
MFVRKSKYDAMHAEASVCSGIAKALAEELNSVIAERDRLRTSVDDHCRYENELRAELAASWRRNTRGHLERHPTNLKPASSK